MAKKQTRRSISVSRNTYERLKVYCETQGISMSQFVESRVGDFLGRTDLSRLEATISRPPPVQVVAREIRDTRDTRETRTERPKDPDVKVSADQIFTF
ncbi:MAG TPA: hypothetical protein VNM90_20300 [Haliangium sp.]|nr:hypothetical protein [Haliangium sp.]